MNFREKSILDGLMKGSEVPQPEWYYFMEMEKISPSYYKRIWFHLDQICQKDHDHIPEKFTIGNETIIKKVKKTRNLKLKKILYNKITSSKTLGLMVEFDDNSSDSQMCRLTKAF